MAKMEKVEGVGASRIPVVLAGLCPELKVKR
jgi:hypothetical protein